MKKWLATGVVIAAGMAFFTGTRGRLDQPEQGTNANVRPGDLTHYYWRQMGLRFQSADPTADRINEQFARFRSGVIAEAADLRDYWKGCADLYDQSAADCRSAAVDVGGLIPIGVDKEAIDVNSAAVEYLKQRGRLHRDSAAECRAYSELYADVVKAGGEIDEPTPAGKKLAEREQTIRSSMLARAGEKQQDTADLQSLLSKADAARTVLAARYHRDFPDFNKR